jgi:hypothetical protein
MNNRVDKNKKDEMRTPAEENLDFPPRSTLHPSNRMRLIHLFYRTLVFLFVLLAAGLIVWGMRLPH